MTSSTTQKGYNRSTLLEILNIREARVKFIKIDGELRTMRCTLNPSLLPEAIQQQWDRLNPSKANQTDLLVTVYDLEMEGWRSFHLESIIEVL